MVEPRVSQKPLPTISVGVGGTDLVQHVVRADHRGDVWETHVVIVLLKELFLVAQFSEIMTPSTEWEPLTTRQQVGKEQLWLNNCKIKIFYVYLDRNFLIEATLMNILVTYTHSDLFFTQQNSVPIFS